MMESPSRKRRSCVDRGIWGAQLLKEREALNAKLRRLSGGTFEHETPLELSTPVDLALFEEAQSRLASSQPDARTLVPGGNTPQSLRIGCNEMRTLYPSPYPDDIARSPNLFVCEFCLKCVASTTTMRRHASKCLWKHPPGTEIYRDGSLSFWEVDGKLAKWYCQNLCLLAKLFLDHKTLYFEVEPFLFYVLTENTATGCRFLGYFSKEKESTMNCNLSCLLTLPTTQRKGYGRFLVDLSYVLSRIEGKIGSPEHPLSDLGLITYRSYWRSVIFDYLKRSRMESNNVSIKDMSFETGIHPNDIVSTLQLHRMIRYHKGKYIILTDPAIATSGGRRQRLTVKPSLLHWRRGTGNDAGDE